METRLPAVGNYRMGHLWRGPAGFHSEPGNSRARCQDSGTL